MHIILHAVAQTNTSIHMKVQKSAKNKFIIKMPKRKSTKLSNEEAIVDILNWTEEDNEDDDMPFVENNDDDDSCSDLYESDIVQSDDEHVEVRRPSRELLTKNRLVHYIDSSLNEEFYDDVHFINRKG